MQSGLGDPAVVRGRLGTARLDTEVDALILEEFKSVAKNKFSSRRDWLRAALEEAMTIYVNLFRNVKK